MNNYPSEMAIFIIPNLNPGLLLGIMVILQPFTIFVAEFFL